MGIVHIVAPALLPAAQFEPGAAPPPVGSSPSPKLASREAFASTDGAVRTGTWEATPGDLRARRGGCGVQPFHCRTRHIRDRGRTDFRIPRRRCGLLPAAHARNLDHPRDAAQNLLRLALTMRVATAALALLVSHGAFSDSPDARADALVRSTMAAHQIPGVVLGVVRNGHLVKATAYGYASVELRVPVSTASIFQSGSVAKQFTATAIMMLVTEGKIGLDDPAVQIFSGKPRLARPRCHRSPAAHPHIGSSRHLRRERRGKQRIHRLQPRLHRG